MEERNVAISIIVPCYNYGHYILDALKSIEAQSFNDWECIIVNDGSTDNSRAVIEKYIENDSRFKLINITNSGVSTARNTAVGHAKGLYIFPLDADNKLHPECLSKCIAEFYRDENLRVVYTEAELFGEESGLWNLPEFDYKTMLKYNMIDNSCMFPRKEFERVGGYRRNMIYGLEDWDFMIALLYGSIPGQVIKIHEPLYYYRVNSAGRRLTVAAGSRQSKMMDLIVYNNFPIYEEYFPDIFTRIHAYEFQKTMLEKFPVRLLTKLLIQLSAWKGKMFEKR